MSLVLLREFAMETGVLSTKLGSISPLILKSLNTILALCSSMPFEGQRVSLTNSQLEFSPVCLHRFLGG